MASAGELLRSMRDPVATAAAAAAASHHKSAAGSARSLRGVPEAIIATSRTSRPVQTTSTTAAPRRPHRLMTNSVSGNPAALRPEDEEARAPLHPARIVFRRGLSRGLTNS